MRQIKFTHTGHSAHPLVGNFAAEDTARLPDEIAHHLVAEAGCAHYIDADPPEVQKAGADGKRHTKAKKGGSK